MLDTTTENHIGIRILVVDDDPEIRWATSSALQKAGYEILEAATGNDALSLAMQHQPEIVLLDRLLPDLDGTDVCARIKKQSFLWSTLVVMISGARIDLSHQLQGLADGADGYITRPIGNQELVARVGAFARIQQRSKSLRQRAEVMVKAVPDLEKDLDREEVRHYIHELQVHQAELEIQNEEMQRSQLALEESRDRFAALYHLSPVGYASLDEAAIIREVNRTLADMIGKPPSQLIGSPFSRWLGDADRPVFHGLFPAFYRYPEGKIMEFHLADDPRKPRIISLQGSRLLSRPGPAAPGSRDGWIQVTAVDVTRQKTAEKSLQESETRYRLLFEEAIDGIGLIDTETGRLAECNNAFADLLGVEKSALLSDHAFPLKPEPLEIPAVHLTLADLQSASGEVREAEAHTAAGQLRYMGLKAKPMLLNEQQLIQVIVRDITRVKESKIARQKLEEQLHQAQKMESVGRLAGGVAHDFNNMLAIILGNTEMALDNIVMDGPLHSILEEIRKAANRSADLVRQLLAFARKQTISPKVLDLSNTVENMLKMLKRLVGENIDLEWLPGENVWPVRMDPSQVDQILANLCVNARDAIEDVGKLTIETGNATFDEAYCRDHPGYAPGDYVLLAVSDDGCGMSQKTMQNLFEPFFTTKEIGKGTGLGLATVYGIVQQNKGFINVSSEPAKGATFKIYLPRHEEIVKPIPNIEQEVKAAGGSETILLVEDEPVIMKMISKILRNYGYTVLETNTPYQALEMAGKHPEPIHLLITDVVMPEMNGRDLAQKLSSRLPDLKCMFMSGYTADIIAQQGVLDEKMHFIQKPFTIRALTAKVREALTG